jgi:hypothetical protein|tara:strand:+ start:2093 stop:3034 length:942 start_codon:yes stop_codon:yes gene_type:complete
MKTTILSILTFLISSTIFAQTTYIPDDNFEQRLIDLGYDDILDDYVLTANISGITNLDIQYQNISDATGLQDFASLGGFNCDNNQISNLNFHPNSNLNFFICQNNPISNLDLTQHTTLFEFSCTNTSITSLDLSQNTNLRYLYCGGTLLTELNLSNNLNLLEIYASNNNFEIVDVRNGNNEEISYFGFQNNPNLPFILVDDCNYSTTNWTNIDPITIFIEEEGQTSCASLGVNDFSLNSSFSIHPNPSNGIFFLSNNHNLQINKIYFVDISGKIIMELTSDFDLINLEGFESGIYFLEIQLDSSIVSKKVIKL